jgi:ketosteroid isomerase-like protein
MLINSGSQVNLLLRSKRKSGSSSWTQRSVFYKKWPILQPLQAWFTTQRCQCVKNTGAYTDSTRIESTKILASLKIPVACFLAVYVLSATAAVAPGEQPKNARAITEIRDVLRAQQDAWNRGDIDGFMNGYARSRSTVFVSEDAVRRGWENVRERYLKKYSDRAKMGLLTFSDLEIMPLGSDSAVVLGRWKLKRAQDRPHGRFTLIFRKTADGWRIVHDHTSAAAPTQ